MESNVEESWTTLKSKRDMVANRGREREREQEEEGLF
jgi:hypothetical protein